VTHLLLLTTFILKKENSVYGSFSLALALLLREEPRDSCVGPPELPRPIQRLWEGK
jgi:hypothetical protein